MVQNNKEKNMRSIIKVNEPDIISSHLKHFYSQKNFVNYKINRLVYYMFFFYTNIYLLVVCKASTGIDTRGDC